MPLECRPLDKSHASWALICIIPCADWTTGALFTRRFLFRASFDSIFVERIFLAACSGYPHHDRVTLCAQQPRLLYGKDHSQRLKSYSLLELSCMTPRVRRQLAPSHVCPHPPLISTVAERLWCDLRAF